MSEIRTTEKEKNRCYKMCFLVTLGEKTGATKMCPKMCFLVKAAASIQVGNWGFFNLYLHLCIIKQFVKVIENFLYVIFYKHCVNITFIM